MGEAKRRKAKQDRLIYHHTSVLRTNQLWMSGVLLPEGAMPPALHPDLGKILTNANLRRGMQDFPPLVWLTKQIEVPNCLLHIGLRFIDKDTGEEVAASSAGNELSNGIAMNRVALGFRDNEIPVQPWPDHYGYETAEGLELNESAREVGDNPDDWWVSEEPIDLLATAEIRVSLSKYRPKLERNEGYLSEVKRMVTLCRETPGAFIPPSWLTPQQAKRLAARMGVPIRSGPTVGT